jgi:RHS repeat-associated protein
MAVVTQNRFLAQSQSGAQYYDPQVITTNDYYAFGGLIPGRHTQTSAYRLAFNGKENDNELLGEGHLQDYGFRPYLPALGRFFSVDPLASKYPELTPFQFASNTPIAAVDLDGLEGISFSSLVFKSTGLTTVTTKQVEYNVRNAPELLAKEAERHPRTMAVANGTKNLVFGGVGVAGAVGATSTAPVWLVGGALVLGISEAAVGFSQMADAGLNDNFDPTATLHQYQTPVGLVMGHNDSPYAGVGDAVTGFGPGMLTSPKVLDGGLIGALKQAKSDPNLNNTSQAVDAVFDAGGLGGALYDQATKPNKATKSIKASVPEPSTCNMCTEDVELR